MKKLFKPILVSSLALLCFSCYYNEFPEEDVNIDRDVSFADDIIPIFEVYDCARCHNDSGQSPNLISNEAYDALVPAYVTAGNPNSSRLYTMLEFEEHRNVDATSIALIKKWIEDGADNN